jgi:hypothetical protein
MGQRGNATDYDGYFYATERDVKAPSAGVEGYLRSVSFERQSVGSRLAAVAERVAGGRGESGGQAADRADGTAASR